MTNFKISQPGDDATKTQGSKLLLDDTYPVWKCDVRKNPRHYGIVKITINSLTAGAVKTLFTIDHNYGYVPSFLVAWNYPAGTDTVGSSVRKTFGIGFISVINPIAIEFDYQVDQYQLRITATAASNASNLYAEFRYYIFAEDFPLATTATFF